MAQDSRPIRECLGMGLLGEKRRKLLFLSGVGGSGGGPIEGEQAGEGS
jgi:hypothetical protein